MNGFTTQANYVRDQAGHQLSEFVPGTIPWQHTNVYANGELIATEDQTEAHFYLNDWLGTRRVQTDYEGVKEQTCSSLPYGDGDNCTGIVFTGKERDQESGLDYFGARYYGSSMGRFMSPDVGADPTLGVPVPYAELENPQSLNLYSYVRNNPLSLTDPDGNNVRLCMNNESGGQNCVNLTDDQWKQIKSGYNPGITISGNGLLGTGSISCGGQACGSATYYEPGLQDETGGELMGIAGGMAAGKAIDAVVGTVAGWFGRGAGEAASSTAAQGGAKVLLSNGTKQAAKDIIDGLADGAQKASAKRAVAAATISESVSISESADGTLTVSRTRPGFD